MLTQERLKELLNYDQYTGIFTWKVRTSNRISIGDVAGSFSKKLGYFLIGIDGIRYYSHRLAWLYITGSLPDKLIDHIDTDGRNNKFSNLREVDHVKNLSNRGKTKKNTSGIKGLSWCERDKAWRVSCVFGDRKLIRQFKDKTEALNTLSNFRNEVVGEYARS